MPEPEARICKFVAENSAYSRRAAGELIKEGRVSVNGVPMLDQSYRVKSSDRVSLDGKELERRAAPSVYVALHKPRGYVSTNSDPHAEKKAVDLIEVEGAPRLFSAGRLDKESEGLLLFSNDGDFVARLTHPSSGVRKRYIVETVPPLEARDLAAIRRGVVDEGERLRAERVEPLPADGRYLFVLSEGKKREIRRLVKACGKNVSRLCRVACGSLELGDLPCGKFRLLSPAEAALAAKNPESD